MAIFLFHFLTIVSSPVSDVQDAAEAADDCEESLWMLVQVVSLVSLGQGSGLTVLTTIRGIRATQSRPGCKYSQSERERESDTNTADSSWIFNKKRYLLDGYLEWLRTLDVLTLGVAEDGGGADQVGDQVVRDGDKLLVCVRITVEDIWHEDGDQEDDQDHDGDPWH